MRQPIWLLALWAGMSCLAGPALAEESSPLTITKVTGPTKLSDGALWLFAVPDGGDSVALSAEQHQALVVGRLDVRRPSHPVEWRVALAGKELGAPGIADHWHMFAHGAHWIVVSTGGGSFLLKLDRDFRRLGLFRVAPASRPGPGGVPTNDMFLVAESDGVAVGHFLPGFGHRMYRFDQNGTPRDPVDFGGGPYRHANGASAERTAGGFLVFAPLTLNPLMYSSIRVIQADADWQPSNKFEPIAEDDMNIVMPSSVALPSGYRIVHARVRALGGEQREPGPAHERRPMDDGMIVRYVLDPSFRVVSRETVAPRGANRPHTALFGDLLLTTWDGDGAVWLRVDRVSK
jgi:hypothetical protein